MTPPRADVGVTQDVMTSPAAIPGGTRPEATPPTTAPRKYGVTSDEIAKEAPRRRRMPSVVMLFRNANAAPRAIIPNAASVRGMYMVVTTDANAPEKPVHRTT